MTTTVAQISQNVVTLSDGTAFELEEDAIKGCDIGIAVGDQVIFTQAEQNLTIFHLQHHKADIRLLPKCKGLPKGRVLVGSVHKPVYDPANPFACEHRHFL
ncbi:MAG: hypothetical protein M1275_00350 [Patescibacteria group bacterium]|nr:hypothetical protein [Patescibacteria group bacterium]